MEKIFLRVLFLFFFSLKMGSTNEEKKGNTSASVTEQLSTNFQI